MTAWQMCHAINGGISADVRKKVLPATMANPVPPHHDPYYMSIKIVINHNLNINNASQPPCPLGILTSANIRWTQSASPTLRTFFGNSYTAPTPSIHTLQLIGLSKSKAYSSLLCNATRTFQLHPTAPTFDLYSYLTLEDTYPVST